MGGMDTRVAIQLYVCFDIIVLVEKHKLHSKEDSKQMLMDDIYENQTENWLNRLNACKNTFLLH